MWLTLVSYSLAQTPITWPNEPKVVVVDENTRRVGALHIEVLGGESGRPLRGYHRTLGLAKWGEDETSLSSWTPHPEDSCERFKHSGRVLSCREGTYDALTGKALWSRGVGAEPSVKAPVSIRVEPRRSVRVSSADFSAQTLPITGRWAEMVTPWFLHSDKEAFLRAPTGEWRAVGAIGPEAFTVREDLERIWYITHGSGHTATKEGREPFRCLDGTSAIGQLTSSGDGSIVAVRYESPDRRSRWCDGRTGERLHERALQTDHRTATLRPTANDVLVGVRSLSDTQKGLPNLTLTSRNGESVGRVEGSDPTGRTLWIDPDRGPVLNTQTLKLVDPAAQSARVWKVARDATTGVLLIGGHASAMELNPTGTSVTHTLPTHVQTTTGCPDCFDIAGSHRLIGDRVLDAEGKMQVFLGSQGQVLGGALSPDGGAAAIVVRPLGSAKPPEVRLISVPDGEIQWTWSGGTIAKSAWGEAGLTFVGDQLLIASDLVGLVRLNAKSGALVRSLGTGSFTDVESGGDRFLVQKRTGSAYHYQLRNQQTGKLLWTETKAELASLSSDGKRVAALMCKTPAGRVHRQCTVVLKDAATGAVLETIEPPVPGALSKPLLTDQVLVMPEDRGAVWLETLD